LSSEALPDRIDGAVCARSRQALLRARTACFVGKPERQLQLHDPRLFEMRDRDRQQRDRLLVTVIRKDAAHQVFGDLR
jgi:hypothetical protein